MQCAKKVISQVTAFDKMTMLEILESSCFINTCVPSCLLTVQQLQYSDRERALKMHHVFIVLLTCIFCDFYIESVGDFVDLSSWHLLCLRVLHYVRNRHFRENTILSGHV